MNSSTATPKPSAEQRTPAVTFGDLEIEGVLYQPTYWEAYPERDSRPRGGYILREVNGPACMVFQPIPWRLPDIVSRLAPEAAEEQPSPVAPVQPVKSGADPKTYILARFRDTVTRYHEAVAEVLRLNDTQDHADENDGLWDHVLDFAMGSIHKLRDQIIDMISDLVEYRPAEQHECAMGEHFAPYGVTLDGVLYLVLSCPDKECTCGHHELTIVPLDRNIMPLEDGQPIQSRKDHQSIPGRLRAGRHGHN